MAVGQLINPFHNSVMKTISRVLIRRAADRDAAAVSSVLRQAFAEYQPLYTKQGYAATTPESAAILIRMQEGPLWVVQQEEQIVATASAVRKEAGLYVRGMAVLPASKGLGIGRRLLETIEAFAAEEGCKRLFLNTTPFLSRAIGLYESFGFCVVDDGGHDLFGTPVFTMEKMLE
jgi:putative acetyltransferase